MSKQVGKRFADLQNGSPTELRLIGYTKGDRHKEKALHEELKLWRLYAPNGRAREWFAPVPEVRNVVFREVGLRPCAEYAPPTKYNLVELDRIDNWADVDPMLRPITEWILREAHRHQEKIHRDQEHWIRADQTRITVAKENTEIAERITPIIQEMCRFMQVMSMHFKTRAYAPDMPIHYTALLGEYFGRPLQINKKELDQIMYRLFQMRREIEDMIRIVPAA